VRPCQKVSRGGSKEQKGEREGRKERGREKSALATQEAEIGRITRRKRKNQIAGVTTFG
jgi:hypothetical protein